MAHELPHIVETEPCRPNQQKTRRGMESWLHHVAESDLPSVEPEVLKRVIPELPTRMVPVVSLGLPHLCELRLRYGANVMGAYEVRRTPGLRFRVA